MNVLIKVLGYAITVVLVQRLFVEVNSLFKISLPATLAFWIVWIPAGLASLNKLAPGSLRINKQTDWFEISAILISGVFGFLTVVFLELLTKDSSEESPSSEVEHTVEHT